MPYRLIRQHDRVESLRQPLPHAHPRPAMTHNRSHTRPAHTASILLPPQQHSSDTRQHAASPSHASLLPAYPQRACSNPATLIRHHTVQSAIILHNKPHPAAKDTPPSRNRLARPRDLRAPSINRRFTARALAFDSVGMIASSLSVVWSRAICPVLGTAYAGLLRASHQHRFRHRRLAFLKQSKLRRESTSNRVSIHPHLNRQAVRRNIVWRFRRTPWIIRHFRILLLFQQRPCVAPIRLTAQNHPRAGGKRLAIRAKRLRSFMHLNKPHTQRVQHLPSGRVVVLLQRHHERIGRPALFYRVLAHAVRVSHQRLA